MRWCENVTACMYVYLSNMIPLTSLSDNISFNSKMSSSSDMPGCGATSFYGCFLFFPLQIEQKFVCDVIEGGGGSEK